MKRPSNFSCTSHAGAGFTLVEMLVVITIIGILAALTIPAVVMVVGRSKDAAITMQLSQLEMACQAYKEKFGEYPPDFTGLTGVTQTDAQNAILAHLAKAFPRYQPGQPAGGANSGWAGLRDDIMAGWGADIDINNFDSLGAMTFWLGGQPDWRVDASGNPITPSNANFDATKPVKGFLGFSADPTNPFASAATSAARIGPFYEFDLACLKYDAVNRHGIMVWPSKACNKSNTYPIVYFRANNGNYLCDGSTSIIKSCGVVYPAADTALSQFAAGTSVIKWINESSIQIFCAGRDATYSALGSTPSLNGFTGRVLAFPTGENYGINTFDDITNFSGGKLENKIP